MAPASTLAFAGITHDWVKHHLFPGDGLEAAVLLMCTRTPGPRLRLLVRDVIPVPHSVCARRRRNAITWPGEYLEAAIDNARDSRSSSSILTLEGFLLFPTPMIKAISACSLACFRPAATCMEPLS
jgi:hypothetical protein